MASDEKKFKGILDKHQKYLDAIHEGIVEGVEEGTKKGAAKGAKRAAWDTFKEECLPQGFMNVSASDVEDIVRNLWALTKNIDGEITKAANKLIEKNVKQYRSRLVADMIKKFRGQRPELAFVLELVTQRENKVGELISGRLPNNPISSGIVKGVQTALRTAIDRSKQSFRDELKDKLEGVEKTTGKSQDTKTAQRVGQIKADSKSITRDAVAKVVEEIVYRLLKMMHKRVLARLRKELGEKLIHKLEQKIGEITEQKMEQLFEKSTDRLMEEIGKDCIEEKSFVENIDKTFGNSAKESLKSMTKWLTPLKTLAIIGAIVVSVGGGVFVWQNLPTTTPGTTTPVTPGTTTPVITSPPITSPTTVTFPDPNLQAAIREAINKPQGPIYISDLVSLTYLYASDRGILNLVGLENCVNLQEIGLGVNNISDISPLAGLTYLQELGLYDNNISDILALNGLTNLENLWLGLNDINDISALSGLTNLQGLFIQNNNISDISPLAGLTYLQQLYLNNNNISDISALAGLTSLTGLWLSGNNINDTSALASLTSLENLWLNENNISDISPLVGLTKLQMLELSSNEIIDILPLLENAGLSEGDTIHLSGNPLSGDSKDLGIGTLEGRGVNVIYQP